MRTNIAAQALNGQSTQQEGVAAVYQTSPIDRPSQSRAESELAHSV